MCHSKNWFDARSYCLEIGGDLAIMNDTRKVKAIQNIIADHRLTAKCASLFIGLRHSVYEHYKDKNETGKVKMFDFNSVINTIHPIFKIIGEIP